MTDRELLERAAKAAGIAWQSFHLQKGLCLADTPGAMSITAHWNPLTDNGDALQLAVKMGIHTEHVCGDTPQAGNVRAVLPNGDRLDEQYGTDAFAATRRAIVRAAAAMCEEPRE